MGRNREKNKRLPKGWAPSASGSIYFRPTNAADRAILAVLRPVSMRLGANADEAGRSPLWLKILAERTKDESAIPGTVAEIVQRARRELLPAIENEKTRQERTRHVNELDRLFGTKPYARHAQEAQRPEFFKALDVQRHVHSCRLTRPVAANREARTWEIVFDDARRLWGLTEYNPCAGLRYNEEAPRDVLPDDDGIFAVFRELDPPMRFLVGMIRYYGRRKGEVLRLQVSSAQKDGLHLRRGKRDRPIIIRWDTRLERMWARLMRWRAAKYRSGKPTTMAIINRDGTPFTVTGFNSAWRRAMKRAKLQGAFTFHDIRATRASTLSREQAVEVLAHDDPATTARVYRRGPLVIDLRAPANSRNDSRKFPKESVGNSGK